LILALSVPVKFGNYISSSFLLAKGGVRAKTVASSIVGSLVVVASVAFIPSLGAVFAAWVMVAGEVLLALLLFRALRLL